MTPDLIVFLQAVSATCAWACALFFYRFWRESHDRLFLLFGVAFLLLSTCWVLLALIDPTDESSPYVFAIRLIAFVLIIVAVIDKNRSARP